MVKNSSALWETWVRSLGWEDTLEEEMANHSSILAWRIPMKEEPGRLQPMGSQRVRHDWATKHSKGLTCLDAGERLAPEQQKGLGGWERRRENLRNEAVGCNLDPFLCSFLDADECQFLSNNFWSLDCASSYETLFWDWAISRGPVVRVTMLILFSIQRSLQMIGVCFQDTLAVRKGENSCKSWHTAWETCSGFQMTLGSWLQEFARRNGLVISLS